MKPGRPYRRTAQALAGRFGLRALAMVTLACVPALLPLLGGPANAPVPPGVPLLLTSLGGVFAAALLGWRTSLLWGGGYISTVPGCHRALLVVAVAAGVLLIAGPLLLLVGLHPPLRAPQALKPMLLTAIAQVGAGFTWGFYIPRRVAPWARMVLVVLLPAVWFNVVPMLTLPGGSPFGLPAVAWGVYHPITVLALLLSPLNWPWLLSHHAGTLLDCRERKQAVVLQRAPGMALDAWLWQRMAPFLGLGRRAWGHWLVLRSAPLGQLWGASISVLTLLLVQWLVAMPAPLLAWTLYLACVAGFAFGAPLRSGLVGRALLLPGGARRATWPGWLARHLAGAVGVGTAIAWVPPLLAMKGFGLDLHDALALAGAIACTAVASIVWTLFSLVRRAGPGRRPAAGFGWLLATAVLVAGAAAAVLFSAPPVWRGVTVGAAFAWVALLAGLALAGARHCTFDD